MSGTNQIDYKFLENLVKETLTSNSNDQAVNIIKEEDVDIELQVFINSLMSGNEKAAISAMEKLITTGEEVEDIYLAAVDRMVEIYGDETSTISEQELDQDEEGLDLLRKKFSSETERRLDFELNPKQRELESHVAMLLVMAANLKRQGKESDAAEVEKLASKISSVGEAELGLAILSQSYFNLSPDRIELEDPFMDLEVVEAGSANAGGVLIQILRLLLGVFGRSKVKPRGGGGSRTISRRSRNQKKRKKNREARQRRKRQSKRRGQKKNPQKPFRRNQKPPRPPVPPASLTGWQRFLNGLKTWGIVLGVANLDDVIGALGVFVEDAIEMFRGYKVYWLYEDSQVQYAIEKFSEENNGRLVGFEQAKLYFAIFSSWNPQEIDCSLRDLSSSGGDSDLDSCRNRINKPQSYFLPEEVELLLKQEKSELTAETANEYLYLYDRYKSIFSEHVTDYVLDEIFISRKAARNFAEVNAILGNKGISANMYLKYCFKGILDLKLNNSLKNRGLSTKFWREFLTNRKYRIKYESAEYGPEIGVKDILDEYKENFIEKFFDYDDEEETSNNEKKFINDVRVGFTAISSASMTKMVDYPGGFNSLIECLENSDLFRNIEEGEGSQRIRYAAQNDFIRSMIAMLIGGTLDAKAVEIFTRLLKLAKDKIKPGTGKEGPWGYIFYGMLIAELTFYFTDPINIYDRSRIKDRFDNIATVIKEERDFHEYLEKPNWIMRKEKLEIIRKDIDAIFEEITDEVDQNITRFYDMFYTEASACQQLVDKIEIKKEAWKHITQFKRAAAEGLLLYEEDPKIAAERGIDHLHINSKNYKYILQAIPSIEETIIELHKQIAVPEVQYFMSAGMSTPEQVMSSLKDPLKNKKEKEDNWKPYDDPTGVTPIIFRNHGEDTSPSHTQDESKRFGGIDKYLISEKVAVQPNDPIFITKFDNKPGKGIVDFIDEMNGLSPGRREFIKSLAKACATYSFDSVKSDFVNRKMKAIQGYQVRKTVKQDYLSIKSARGPFGGEDETPGRDKITPMGTLGDEEFIDLVDAGLQNFKKAMTSNQKFFTHSGQTPDEMEMDENGLYIEFPILHRNTDGGLYRKNSGIRGIIIANPRFGVSMKYPNLKGGAPIIKTVNFLEGIGKVSELYIDGIKPIYDLLNNKIKASKKYKVIYDPKDVIIKSTDYHDWMINTSALNNSNNQPVVDVLVDSITVEKNTDIDVDDLFSGNFLEDSRLNKEDTFKSTLTDLNNFQNLVFQYKNNLMNLDDAGVNNLQRKYKNPQIQRLNIQACNILNTIIYLGKVMINAWTAAAMEYKELEYSLGLLIDKVNSTAAKNTESIKIIDQNIKNIQKLFFTRPVGELDLEDDTRNIKRIIKPSSADEDDDLKVKLSPTLSRSETDPDIKSRAAKDTRRAQRCMFVKKGTLQDIINSNAGYYNKIIEQVEIINKSGESINITELSGELRGVISALKNIMIIDAAMVDSGFHVNQFIREQIRK